MGVWTVLGVDVGEGVGVVVGMSVGWKRGHRRGEWGVGQGASQEVGAAGVVEGGWPSIAAPCALHPCTGVRL